MKTRKLTRPGPIRKWGDPRLVENLFRTNEGPDEIRLPTWLESEKTLADLASGLRSVTRQAVRFEFLNWVRQLRPNIFATLTIGPHTSYITFSAQADRLINTILQEVYGRRWSDFPLDVRPTVIGFLEHPNTNPHYHLLIRGDEYFHYAFLVHAPRIWRKLMTHAAVDAEIIRSADDVVRYCLKEQVTLDRFESAYVYAPMKKSTSVKC